MQINNFYSKEGIFCDKDGDGFYDGIKGKIYIRENSSIVEKLAALNILSRLSYECTAMSADNIEFFTSEKEEIPENSIMIFTDDNVELDDDETSISIFKNRLQIISKTTDALSVNCKYIYGRMPYVWYVGKQELMLDSIIREISCSLFTNIYIDKLIISKEYQGLKNVYLCGKSPDIYEAFRELKENQDGYFKKFDMIKTITVNIDGNKLILCNENFKEIKHCTSDITFKNSKSDSVDLSDIFSINGIYADNENDMMNNRMNFKIAVDKDISDILVKAVGNLVVRTAIDCLELRTDLVELKSQSRQSNIIEIKDNKSENAKLYFDQSKNNIVLEGGEAGIMHLCESLAKQYPYIDVDKAVQLKDIKDHFDNILKCKNYQGQASYLMNILKNRPELKKVLLCADVSDKVKVEPLINIIKSEYKNQKVEILNYKAADTIWNEAYEPVWEVDVFKNIIKNEVYPLLNSGDEVTIQGCLSEEKSIRDNLSNEIKEYMHKAGAVLKSSYIFSTYKQGFSWITEKVIPELKELERIDEVLIKFKPFMPEGTKVWFDENGATPTSSKILEDDKDRWFDLPIRFLQELYPVDDMIANELGIDRKNIIFKDDDTLSSVYEIICYADGNEIYRDKGTAKVSERPYLDEFPELGKVHPTTGWITVFVNGNKVVDRQIKTDFENIWDFYQKNVLNKAKEYIIKNGNGKILVDKQPFFKELKIEAEISELDYKLPVRKDLISSLDAFHEDIYFVGSDFFKFLGQKMAGVPATEPGLIIPVLKKRNGLGPKVKASIVKELYDRPKLVADGKETDLSAINSNGVTIDSIEYSNNNIVINLNCCSDDFKLISSYCRLVNENIVDDEVKNSMAEFCFKDKVSGRKCILNSKKNITKKEKKYLDKCKLPTGRLIGYDDYINIMHELKDVKHINSYISAKSYQGRNIYTIEMIDYELNDIVSRAKLINNKPVCFINSRHHANEISSTNAAFELVEKLLTDESYDHYLKQLNIIIIPFENPDGGYMHYELQKDNPEWKLHVSRFDSLGKDITAEWFNLETKHTEALAYTKTWYKWLPDVVTDNHGVPSHEWDQQFSGYVSPSFKGFWLPRALYYGYFWYITDEEYTDNNVGVAKLIQDRLSDLLNSDEEMTRWNIDWADRFEKYAHKWMPKMFPADYYKNLIYYWIPFNTKKDQKYSSHRYPNITSLDWTTEVSDETATGEYLGLCASAHVDGCRAVMDSVISLNNKAEVLDYEKDGQIVLNRKRKRPLYL